MCRSLSGNRLGVRLKGPCCGGKAAPQTRPLPKSALRAFQARLSRSVTRKRKREDSVVPTPSARSRSCSRTPRDVSGLRDAKVSNTTASAFGRSKAPGDGRGRRRRGASGSGSRAHKAWCHTAAPGARSPGPAVGVPGQPLEPCSPHRGGLCREVARRATPAVFWTRHFGCAVALAETLLNQHRSRQSERFESAGKEEVCRRGGRRSVPWKPYPPRKLGFRVGLATGQT